MLVLIDDESQDDKITLQCSNCGLKYNVPIEKSIRSCQCENEGGDLKW